MPLRARLALKVFIMNISGLLSVIEENTNYQKLVNSLNGPSKIGSKLVISNPARSYLTAALYRSLKMPVLIITSQPETAKKIYDELLAWCPTGTPIRLFPETDFLSGEFSSTDSAAVIDRLQTLATLVHYRNQITNAAAPPIIVGPASAIISKTIPQSEFARAYHTIEVGTEIAPLQLIGRWQELGYEMIPANIKKMENRYGGGAGNYKPPRWYS